MKNIFLLCCTIFFFSCSKKQQDVAVFKYALEQKDSEYYVLNSELNNGVAVFKYVNAKDILQNLDLKFIIEKESLNLNQEIYTITSKTYSSASLEFKMYQKKDVKNNISTLVFNKDYGLLASVSAEANFVLLKDTITALEKEVFFKELFINLNKIKF
jgi:hypothetical protein